MRATIAVGLGALVVAAAGALAVTFTLPALSAENGAAATNATTAEVVGDGAGAGAGATTPFTSYEAEAGTRDGGATVTSVTAPPTTQYDTQALEASGHAYVRLSATGQSLTWTNTTGKPITAINLRESIPDSTTGGGITATLNLYVDGVFRQALDVNSKQTWDYEGKSYQSHDQNPASGHPRAFFDETHTFVKGAAIAPGSTFSVRKDAANAAAYYDIDVIDVEQAPAPLPQPAGSLSITDCGAVASNVPTNGTGDPTAKDSTDAIQNCINQAQSSRRTLWIPPGTFYLKGTRGLTATGITIAGAGYWYSTIYRQVPLPNPVPLGAIFTVTSCTVQNFHLDSNAASRATIDGDGGAMDTTGTNWVAEGLWSQHVMSGFWASGTGGVARNNRLTSIFADGLNINNVAVNNSIGNNLTATNNFIRGTGDDGMAINSVNYNEDDSGRRTYYTAMSNATVKNNTVIGAWGGKGIGIYGGSGHVVEGNYVSDTSRYIGLGAGVFGLNGSGLQSATVANNVIERAGGNAWNQNQAAVHIGDGAAGQNSGTIANVNLIGNTITGALFDAVGFSASTATVLQHNTIIAPWRNGIVVAPPPWTAPTGSATISGNTVTGLLPGTVPFGNNSDGFTASVSGNSWQTTIVTGQPYGGSPAAVPGAVQAENYDTGGQGVAYNVTSVNGSGIGYRADGVDLEPTSDADGGWNLGWTSGEQWQRYSVTVADAGTYTVAFRVAAPSAVTGAFHLSNASGANLTGAVNVPATGAWQAWTTVRATVSLPSGKQVLTLNQDNGGWNLNYLNFTAATAASSIDPAAWYEIVNENSLTCIDARDFATTNATAVQQWACAGPPNQQWQFTPVSSGVYRVGNRNATAQNQAWDVTGTTSATAPGTPIQTWTYAGATNQQWEARAVGEGWYTFTALHSGLCLTVPDNSTANGVQLEQDICTNAPAQRFKLVRQP
jgi:hypothetical protein